MITMRARWGVAVAAAAACGVCVRAQTLEECIAAAVAIDFDLEALDRFDEYFTNASVMQLSQTGKYVGPDAIREYVAFLQGGGINPFLVYSEFLGRPRNENVVLPKPSSGGLCETLVVFENSYGFTEASGSQGYTLRVVPMFRLWHDPQALKIVRINVYYGEGFTPLFMGTLLDTASVNQHVCTLMKEECADVWQANNIGGIKQCVGTMAALPAMEKPGDFLDGNSSGCRVIHSVLAGVNSFHCPHVSFVPVADDDGSIKCQVSAEVPVSALFEPADLEFWQATTRQFGFPTGYEAVGPPCSDDSDCKPGFICASAKPLPARSPLFSSNPSVCLYG